MVTYAATLSNALTPITLISGVGLLLLAMSARYNHTTDRVRQLLKERKKILPRKDSDLERAINLIYERSHLLKNAILAVTISAAFSGILVLVSILENILNLKLEVWKSTILLTAVIFIVTSTIFFVMEVHLSLKALGLSIENGQQMKPRCPSSNRKKLIKRRFFRKFRKF
ncbi:DUF2721 domain-containing protein [Turicimonas muris]|uniref:DUF2721 domain-containing protein n=1 Tax=Turicimonas muris TaxID=1796652 RepID=UPI0025B211F9|nr:DUF2721 domain-containing protein [Turicimonas muris]